MHWSKNCIIRYPNLHAGWRQRSAGFKQRPWLHRCGPGGEHPPDRGSSKTDGRCRIGCTHRIHLTLPFRVEAAEPYSSLTSSKRYVNVLLATAEQRDPKGLYRKADAANFRTLPASIPYEPPLAAEMEVNTDKDSVEDCVQQLLVLFEKI